MPNTRRNRSDHLMYLEQRLGFSFPASSGVGSGAEGTTWLREEACEESTRGGAIRPWPLRRQVDVPVVEDAEPVVGQWRAQDASAQALAALLVVGSDAGGGLQVRPEAQPAQSPLADGALVGVEHDADGLAAASPCKAQSFPAAGANTPVPRPWAVRVPPPPQRRVVGKPPSQVASAATATAHQRSRYLWRRQGRLSGATPPWPLA